MKISFYTPQESRTTSVGYGNAGFNMVTSLQALGHEVPFDDPTAPVAISFCNPYGYKFHEGQYKIGYTPWESTHVPYEWLDRMAKCDEIWATSPWVAEVYEKANIGVPIHVYEHGIDKQWQPIKREPSRVVKYLHVGEPALRKGGQMALDAFREAFGDNENVHLTIKAYHQHYLRAWTEKGFSVVDNNTFNNVTIITKEVTKADLMALYADHHVMVYPTYGEGFGFIPLQALATGMPVITTDAWAPYAKYLSRLALKSHQDRSIWSVHPGDVYYPDYKQLVWMLDFTRRAIKPYLDVYYKQAPDVIAEYDWLKKTESAFEHLVKKFG